MNIETPRISKLLSRFLCTSVVCNVLGLLSIYLVINAWRFQDAPTLHLAYEVGRISIFLFIVAIVFGSIYYYQGRKSNQKNWWAIINVCASIACINILCLYFKQYPKIYGKQACQVALRNMSRALNDYIQDNKKSPPADAWCDALLNYTKNHPDSYTHYFENSFNCYGANVGKSNYAINSNVTPNTRGHIVWVFDSNEGWNLHGGRELLNCNNHEGKGCNVLFFDGKIEFIEKDELDELKWE